MTNALDGVINVDLFVGSQLIHHVQHRTKQTGTFYSVSASTQTTNNREEIKGQKGRKVDTIVLRKFYII